MDVVGRLLAPNDVEVLALWCSRANKNGVETFVEHAPKAIHFMAEMRLDAEADNPIDLLIQHTRWQAECRDISAHETARHWVPLKQHATVTKWQEIARDSQRGRAGAE